jgi:hypothetical protein
VGKRQLFTIENRRNNTPTKQSKRGVLGHSLAAWRSNLADNQKTNGWVFETPFETSFA